MRRRGGTWREKSLWSCAVGASLAALLAACSGVGSVATSCTLRNPRESLIYDARPSPAAPVTEGALDLTVRKMCERIRLLGGNIAGARRLGSRQVELQLAHAV